VYRRWPNKQLLVAAAIAWAQEPPTVVTGRSARGDLRVVLEDLLRWAANTTAGRALPQLLGMQVSPAIKEHCVRTVLEPWMTLLTSVLRRGVQTRELDPDLDIEMTVMLLFGAVLSRLMLAAGGAGPLAEAAVSNLPGRTVDIVLFGAVGGRRRAAPEPDPVNSPGADRTAS